MLHLHMTSIALLAFVILLRGASLFVGIDKGQITLFKTKFIIGLQHLAVTLVVVSGLILLWNNQFTVQPWFYAKVILFLVVLSSLHKAFRNHAEVLLVQRRFGWSIATVALICIIAIALIKPSF